MGTYVKGMETPTWCGECEFLSGLIMPDDEYHCYAPTSDKNNSINVTDNVENWDRPDWCPLVEVSEPHRKLVEFIDVTTYEDDDSGTEEVNLGEAFAAYFKMREAKPVIEAEGE